MPNRPNRDFPRAGLTFAAITMDSLEAQFKHLLLAEENPRCTICLFPLPPHTDAAEHDAFNQGVSQADIAVSARRGCENCVILATSTVLINKSCECGFWSILDGKPLFVLVPASDATDTSDSLDDVSELEICTPDPRFCRPGPGFDKAAAAHPALVYGTKLVGGTGDEVALSQAARWLEDCRLNHPKCQAKLNPNFVPSRLLRINTNNELFRLLDHDDTELRLPVAYAALSHRWSSETEAIILTTANLEDRKQHGIAVDDLPGVMRDAIFVLRRLGLSYIWIDSLCIIQNSAADWQHEAGQMADVYSNAELTLSATWVPGQGQSLFCDRQDPREFSTMDIGPIQPNGMRPFFLRPSLQHFEADRLDSRALDANKKYWPLMNRGWVYQEQFLSPRSLHFTRHELAWVCLESHACECGRLMKVDDPAVSPDLARTNWRTIVEAYSKRVLTKFSDRLPAIAGVAARYSTTTSSAGSPGRYLCGLWERDLLSMLAWRMEEPRPRGETLVPMPTWSWAAVPGGVVFRDLSFSDGLELVEARVEYHGDSFMGSVKEARLVLAGPTVQGTISYNKSPSPVAHDAPQFHDPSCSDSRRTSCVVYHDGTTHISVLNPDYMLGCAGEHSVPGGAKVTLLVFPPPPQDDKGGLFVLVLQEVPGTESRGRPLYRRIGSINEFQGQSYAWVEEPMERRVLEII